MVRNLKPLLQHFDIQQLPRFSTTCIITVCFIFHSWKKLSPNRPRWFSGGEAGASSFFLPWWPLMYVSLMVILGLDAEMPTCLWPFILSLWYYSLFCSLLFPLSPLVFITLVQPITEIIPIYSKKCNKTAHADQGAKTFGQNGLSPSTLQTEGSLEDQGLHNTFNHLTSSLPLLPNLSLVDQTESMMFVNMWDQC